METTTRKDGGENCLRFDRPSFHSSIKRTSSSSIHSTSSSSISSSYPHLLSDTQIFPYDHYTSWNEFETKTNASLLARRLKATYVEPVGVAAKLSSGEILPLDLESNTGMIMGTPSISGKGSKHHHHQLDEARVQLSLSTPIGERKLMEGALHHHFESSPSSCTSFSVSNSPSNKTTSSLTASSSFSSIKHITPMKKISSPPPPTSRKLWEKEEEENFVAGAEMEEVLRDDGLLVGVLGREEKKFPEETYGPPVSPGNYFDTARDFPTSSSSSKDVWTCRVGEKFERAYGVVNSSKKHSRVVRASLSSITNQSSSSTPQPSLVFASSPSIRLNPNESGSFVLTCTPKALFPQQQSVWILKIKFDGDDQPFSIIEITLKVETSSVPLLKQPSSSPNPPPLILVSIPCLIFTPRARVQKFKLMNPSSNHYVKLVVSTISNKKLQLISSTEKNNEFILGPKQAIELIARWLDGFDESVHVKKAVSFKVFTENESSKIPKVLCLDAKTKTL